MHEHHEQEMTPSALSYQLRDTILHRTGNATNHRTLESGIVNLMTPGLAKLSWPLYE
jgi:hypothetical protein